MSKHPPNPLPCGCGAKGIQEVDIAGTRVNFKNVHVVHCPLHAAAPELLETLEAVVKWDTEHPVSYVEFEEIRKRADVAIAKAKGDT